MSVCVIVPAHNEELFIEDCLRALIEDRDTGEGASTQIIVIANGCDDETADIARDMITVAQDAGYVLTVLETDIAGKCHALNLGDAACNASTRIYLDADVVCGPGMIKALRERLAAPGVRYASGDIQPDAGPNLFAALYRRVWMDLPFVKSDVCGCGLYAVNAEGRKRWQQFPDIVADDKFVRLHFKPDERAKVDVAYRWPLPKSLRDLIVVRSRWCRGNSQLTMKFPHLSINETNRRIKPIRAMSLALKAPLGCVVFTSIYTVAKVRAFFQTSYATSVWERGR